MIFTNGGEYAGRVHLPYEMQGDPFFKIYATDRHYILLGSTMILERVTPKILLIEKGTLQQKKHAALHGAANVSLDQVSPSCVLGMIVKLGRVNTFCKVCVRFDDARASFTNVLPVSKDSEMVFSSETTVCIASTGRGTITLISHNDSRVLWKTSFPCQQSHSHAYHCKGSSIIVACLRQVAVIGETGDTQARLTLDGGIHAGLGQICSAVVSKAAHGYVALSSCSSDAGSFLTTIEVLEVHVDSHSVSPVARLTFIHDCHDYRYAPNVRAAAITSTSVLYVQTHRALLAYDLQAEDVEGSGEEVFRAQDVEYGKPKELGCQEWEDHFICYIWEDIDQQKCFVTIFDCLGQIMFKIR